MSIEFEDVTETLRCISISGRLDVPGTDAIATRFTALAASVERRIVVDISEVSFLASMGIRALIMNAKAQQQRGGRLVLFIGGNQPVGKVLESTGIDALIPICTDMAEARVAALA
ncbi:STAS domain-containing protein [Methyloversatilis sp. XJ19-49]|uniref:STAS domain-containing protein n=1 Tax=Methyloversatilis sp. XJ19-49 TaxID=2963429 RepID=UPI00211BE6D0|nr:STAS domain-containing protein [Methyloversatilis sp. XJ19-49]MCQ9378054.1 STAS domain-containing protein [Methyloversatilis sp. XJ19-49]